MSLFQKILELEKRLDFLESSFPNWIPLTKGIASQYGYSINGLRNFCLTNIEPKLFKKIDGFYHIHKTALIKLNKKC